MSGRAQSARADVLLLAIAACAAMAAGAREASAQSEPRLLTPPPRAARGTAVDSPRPLPADRRPQLLTPIPPKPDAVSAAPAPTAPIARITPLEDGDVAPAAATHERSVLRVSKGTGVLPNEHGQVWREYDISPYTLAQQAAASPEQAVIDWILRETGTEVWFGEPLGILSASSTTLRVYHTPQMQMKVQGIVERLIAAERGPAVGVRLMTVDSPNWRAAALALLKPVEVNSPGVEAWLLSRENAALLLSQLKARSDMREHSAPVEIASGQVQTLSRTQPRQYTKSVQLKREYPFYDLVLGKIDEGYSLEISPLASADGSQMEAALTCRIDQVEKLTPLAIDVPIGPTQSQRVQIQVPQLVSWRLGERFRWPADQVLLVSCGVVASPAASGGAMRLLAPLGIGGADRADALLMIECHERQK